MTCCRWIGTQHRSLSLVPLLPPPGLENPHVYVILLQVGLCVTCKVDILMETLEFGVWLLGNAIIDSSHRTQSANCVA
ncbi:hypothetical protein F2P79_005266 [Pimephales promelas]|nr:hypothetical protein F2P79_005266 [Pimephales promelas]